MKEKVEKYPDAYEVTDHFCGECRSQIYAETQGMEEMWLCKKCDKTSFDNLITEHKILTPQE